MYIYDDSFIDIHNIMLENSIHSSEKIFNVFMSIVKRL